MSKGKNRPVSYAKILQRLRNQKLKDEDYEILARELEKVVRVRKPSGGRRIVAHLPFGMDIVK